MSEWKGKTPEQGERREQQWSEDPNRRAASPEVSISGGYGEDTGFAAPENAQVSDLDEGTRIAASDSSISGSRRSVTPPESSSGLEGREEPLKGEVRRTAQDSKETAVNMVAKQKQRAGEEIGRLGSALRAAADRLESDNDQTIAAYVSTAAEKVSEFERRLKERDTDSLLRDVEGFARRHPEVVFGGMFLGGLAIARFLKSSAHSRQQENTQQDSYSTPRPAASHLLPEGQRLPVTEEEKRHLAGYESTRGIEGSGEQPGPESSAEHYSGPYQR